MTKRYPVLLSLLIAGMLTGCTSTHQVHVISNDVQPTGINSDLEGSSATVAMRNGGVFRARSANVSSDSTSWIDPASGELHVVPTREIASITKLDRGKGAVRGLLVGSVALAGIGIVPGLLVGGSSALGSGDDDDLGEGIALGMLIGGLVGGGVGAGIGAVMGKKTRYVFSGGQ